MFYNNNIIRVCIYFECARANKQKKGRRYVVVLYFPFDPHHHQLEYLGFMNANGRPRNTHDIIQKIQNSGFKRADKTLTYRSNGL